MNEVNFVKPKSFLLMLHRVAKRELFKRALLFVANMWVRYTMLVIEGDHLQAVSSKIDPHH